METLKEIALYVFAAIIVVMLFISVVVIPDLKQKQNKQENSHCWTPGPGPLGYCMPWDKKD